MKGIALWQKNADFWQIISKKIREMGSYLITYCCHPPVKKPIVIHGHSTVRPWSTP
jgi:hypothetical protein